MEERKVSVQQACRVVNLPRSQWYYKSKRDDHEVEVALQELADLLPTRGFDNYFGRLRSQGYTWNRKRVLRVYRTLQLPIRRKRKRRLPASIKHPLVLPITINRTWSADFMHDSLEYGRRIRVLNIIDDYSREALRIEADYSHSGESVVRIMSELVWERGIPRDIRVDNGPEFRGNTFTHWCKDMNINILFIQPGKPMQNAYIERFNRLFREDVLDAYLFEDLEQLRKLSEEWREDYNLNHPHSGLNGLSPLNYRNQINLNLSSLNVS